jgi:hypothetical protein
MIRHCLGILEVTLMNIRSSRDRSRKERKSAPESSWRRLMGAYTQAGISPSIGELSKVLIILG